MLIGQYARAPPPRGRVRPALPASGRREAERLRQRVGRPGTSGRFCISGLGTVARAMKPLEIRAGERSANPVT